MGRPSFDEDKQKLLDVLKEQNGAAGNAALQRALGWRNEDRYWNVRNSLIEAGVLTTGRGRGGSVRFIGLDAPAPPPETEASDKPTDALSETDHYPAIEKAMREQWLRSQGFENFRVNICAHQGKKQTGGRWTRPDAVVAVVETYEYVPGKRLSVYTVEVKLGDAADVTAVYEAASHLRSVHYAYLFVIGTFASDDLESTIRSACLDQGIGLILAKKVSEADSWDEIVPPARNEPEPRDLNNTIYHFLEDKEWLKREVR